MRKKIHSIVLAVVLIVVSLFVTSCSSKDGSSYTFRFSIINDPQNLDPQVATDDASINIIGNLFDGLLKLDDNGSIVNGVALKYEVSSDGLKYTFTLRDDYFWKSKGDYKEKVIADDFVFTFQRLALKSTKSPYSENFFMIKNLEKIYNGEEDLSKLGVYAENENTLVIELEHPESTFPVLLTTSPAFPCNESFFDSTEGKYGLETNSVAANGPFYLNSWLYDAYGQDNYVVLKKNAYYNDIEKVYPLGINYFVSRGRDKSVSDYDGERTDVIIDDGTTSSLIKKSIVNSYNDKTTGIVFNMSDSVFSVDDVRQALSYAIDRNSFSKISDYTEKAGAVVPSAVTILNKSYRELVSQPAFSGYNISLAKYLWSTSLTQSQLDSLSGVTLITCKDFSSSDNYSSVTEQWKNVLSFYCPVEVISRSEYEQRIKDGNYKIAVCQIDGSYNSPASYLDSFSDGYISSLTGFYSEEYNSIMQNAHYSLSLSSSIGFYEKAEKYLIDNNYFIPCFYEKDYFLYHKELSDISYDAITGIIRFSQSKKK